MSPVKFIEVDVAVFEDRCPKCLGEDGCANRVTIAFFALSSLPRNLRLSLIVLASSGSTIFSFRDQGHFPSFPSPSSLLSELLESPLLSSESPRSEIFSVLILFDS